MLQKTASPELDASSTRSSQRALQDVLGGLARHQLWRALAWNEIRQRYRRSLIGPFWLTLSMGIMVAALGFLYAALLRQPVEAYIPYLAVGLILWTFISALILEGCSVFINAAGIMRQVAAPLSVHVYLMVWRNMLIFFHNCAIYVLIVLFFGINPLLGLLFLPMALAIYAINGIWIGLLLGLLCSRFRDITMMVASLVQILFFFTPVIWMPEIIPDRQWVVQYNPVFHFIEIARAPLLGRMPTFENWAVSIAVTIAGAALAFTFFRRYRARIVYWA